MSGIFNINGQFSFKNQGLYMKKEEYERLAKARESQILTQGELISKISSNSKEIRCLNPESKDNKVFVYCCKEGLETDTMFHLYNNNGELIMTFPWNGDVIEHLSHPSMKKEPIYSVTYVDEMLTYDRTILSIPINRFRFTATESGNIFINTIRDDKDWSSVWSQFKYNGIKQHIAMPCFDPKKYPNQDVAQKVEKHLKSHKYDGIVFAGAAFGGDEFIKYGMEHSHVI